ncbi:hypothetical protein WJX74_004499 [Apatococcus lobatus]|uniref:Uncharacterized protein n=1 Tax=Apatococcus lobatus TaxID=904363 RepID=A0AAW1R134_9CHLO
MLYNGHALEVLVRRSSLRKRPLVLLVDPLPEAEYVGVVHVLHIRDVFVDDGRQGPSQPHFLKRLFDDSPPLGHFRRIDLEPPRPLDARVQGRMHLRQTQPSTHVQKLAVPVHARVLHERVHHLFETVVETKPVAAATVLNTNTASNTPPKVDATPIAAFYHNAQQYPVDGWATFEEGGQQHAETDADRQVTSVGQAKKLCANDPSCIGFLFNTLPEKAWTKLIRGPNYTPLTRAQAEALPHVEEQDTSLWMKLS